MSAPRVAVLAERRHLADLALTQAVDSLQDRGIAVEVVVPDPARLDEVPTARPRWDLVLSRGRDAAQLAALGAADALGVPTLNTPGAVELVRNKIVMMATLARHELPLPRTWHARDPRAFAAVDPGAFPLVLKPFDGDGARGIALVTRPGDLELLAPADGTLWLAQEYLDAGGYDLKLYGIGSRVWAVRKPSPVVLEAPGPAPARTGGRSELVELDDRLRDIALTCGRACRLDLWGVDVALTRRGPRVIEVNDFPTYSQVPDAGVHIADLAASTLELAALTARYGHGSTADVVRARR